MLSLALWQDRHRHQCLGVYVKKYNVVNSGQIYYSQQPPKVVCRELEYFLCTFTSPICKENVLISSKFEQFHVSSGCSDCGNTSGFVRTWFVEHESVFPLPDSSLKRCVVIPLHFFLNGKLWWMKKNPFTPKIKGQYKPREIVVFLQVITCMLTYATSSSWEQV